MTQWFQIQLHNVNGIAESDSVRKVCTKLDETSSFIKGKQTLKNYRMQFPLLYSKVAVGPLINRLKWFLLKICFRGDIRIFSSQNSAQRRPTLRGVEHF